jgi:uncharacterized membrane protein YfcA
MTPVLGAALCGLGFCGAFVSGLLGVGGAIVMIPLLLYAPPLLGVGALDVKAVSGVTMAQVFVAALSGMLAHRRRRAVHAELVWLGGLAMAAASFVGALASIHVADKALLFVFALMATAAVFLMLAPVQRVDPPAVETPLRFSRPRILWVAGIVGVAAGLVGAGGAFLLVPLLLAVVRVPIRLAIGSSLGIVTLSATAGLAGKLATGQVPLAAALMVTLGAVPGAQVGAALSHRVAAKRLKWVLAAVILVTVSRVWWDLLAR